MDTKTKIIVVIFFAMVTVIACLGNSLSDARKERDNFSNQLAEQVAINKDYKSRIQSLHELDTMYTQELTNAKTEIDSLRDAVKSGTKRVYIKAECPKAGADTSEGGSNETAPRLSEATEQDYWRLREMIAENEKQTLYLQDYIRTECLR